MLLQRDRSIGKLIRNKTSGEIYSKDGSSDPCCCVPVCFCSTDMSQSFGSTMLITFAGVTLPTGCQTWLGVPYYNPVVGNPDFVNGTQFSYAWKIVSAPINGTFCLPQKGPCHYQLIVPAQFNYYTNDTDIIPTGDRVSICGCAATSLGGCGFVQYNWMTIDVQMGWTAGVGSRPRIYVYFSEANGIEANAFGWSLPLIYQNSGYDSNHNLVIPDLLPCGGSKSYKNFSYSFDTFRPNDPTYPPVSGNMFVSPPGIVSPPAPFPDVTVVPPAYGGTATLTDTSC